MDGTEPQSEGLGESLTVREQEILVCLAEGLSNQEIAAHLHLAHQTVKWYNSQIYSKLGVTNREAALAVADAYGLLETQAEKRLPLTIRVNLPTQATTFVGRKSELIEIARLLQQPNTRLVTILAPGGMGKTRLALEAARRQLPRFKDGVFFVPLAPLISPDYIVTTIAEQVGFSFFGSASPQQQLLNYLGELSILLVLDNFEHLLDGASLVADLIKGAPNLRVLTTSRERLNLHGETVYSLSGLAYPTLETQGEILEYDAIKLFLQSAQRLHPDYQLQPDDFDYLALISRLTEGMPLGVELAAGWVDVLSLEHIAVEIQKGIDILETDMRDVPQRHRSIRATFESTLSRLTPEERQVFGRLSVFRGGFALPAAQVVADTDVRSLRKLANKALLTRTPRGRYEIHELLRQIAEDHLRESGTIEMVRKIHSEYYLQVVSQLEADIKGRRQLAALHEIEIDFENIRAAWHRGVANDCATALRSAIKTLEVFGECGKRINDIHELFQGIIEHEFPDDHRLRCLAFSRACHLLTTYKQNMVQIESCMTTIHSQDEPLEVAYQLRVLGAAIGTVRQELSQAVRLLEEATALYKAHDDAYGVAASLRELAYWLTAAGYNEKSQVTVEQSYHLSRQIGAKNIQAFMAAYLGVIAADRFGQFDEAKRLYTEAIDIFREMNANYHLAGSLANFGFWVYLLADGDLAAARDYANQSLQLAIDTHNADTEALSNLVLGMVTGIERDYSRAKELLETGHRLAVGETYKTLIADCGLALVHYGLGNLNTAKQHVRGVLSFFLSGFRCVSITIAVCIEASEGNLERAAELMGFVSESPNSPKGWMQQWSEIASVRSKLETELGTETYLAAWERGKILDLEMVVKELLMEYNAQNT